jgi:hypothetical protein
MSQGEPSPLEIRQFTDAFVQALIHDDRHAGLWKMSAEFRAKTDENGFKVAVERLDSFNGKILEADYKTTDTGTLFVPFERKKEWVAWYAVRTTKHAKGTHFAKIEVVMEPGLAVWSWAVVSFLGDKVPSNLK